MIDVNPDNRSSSDLPNVAKASEVRCAKDWLENRGLYGLLTPRTLANLAKIIDAPYKITWSKFNAIVEEQGLRIVSGKEHLKRQRSKK